MEGRGSFGACRREVFDHLSGQACGQDHSDIQSARKSHNEVLSQGSLESLSILVRRDLRVRWEQVGRVRQLTIVTSPPRVRASLLLLSIVLNRLKLPMASTSPTTISLRTLSRPSKSE
jgi:hypothetical protein